MRMRFALFVLNPAALRPIGHGHRLTPRAEAQ